MNIAPLKCAIPTGGGGPLLFASPFAVISSDIFLVLDFLPPIITLSRNRKFFSLYPLPTVKLASHFQTRFARYCDAFPFPMARLFIYLRTFYLFSTILDYDRRDDTQTWNFIRSQKAAEKMSLKWNFRMKKEFSSSKLPEKKPKKKKLYQENEMRQQWNITIITSKKRNPINSRWFEPKKTPESLGILLCDS